MKYSHALSLCILIIPMSLYAQPEQLDHFINPIIDVFTQNKLHSSQDEKQAFTKLVNQNELNSCSVEMDQEKSCKGFVNSLLPKDYKEEGWKTLLEIKYQPTQKKVGRSESLAKYKKVFFTSFEITHGTENKELENATELEDMSKNI